jgi:regulator of sirC expression with transglutaminase-like and TPR domain
MPGNYFELIKANETDWDLFLLSIEICRIIEPELVSSVYTGFVDEISSECLEKISRDEDLYGRIEAVNSILYDRYGFSGNEEDYYDPSNSYMTRVIECRKGIPITLSILYSEVASRVGVDLYYVALPGHFLLKFKKSNQEIFIDAFSEGKMILPSECRQLVENIYGKQIEFKPSFLQRANKRTILLRLLVNLKQIYRVKKHDSKLLDVIEHRIPLMVDPVREILERGLTRLSLRDYQGAMGDIEMFLENNSDEKIKEVLTSRLRKIRELAKGN